MAIRTQNGRVLLKNGRVSCECCDTDIIDLSVAVGEISDCACEELNCYDDTNPAPNYRLQPFGGAAPGNPYTDRFGFTPFYFQIQWFLTTTPQFATPENQGWKNIVTEPTIMEFSGTLAGAMNIVTGGENGLDYWIGETVDEGCGTCATQRPDQINFNTTFVLYPFTQFYITIWYFFGWKEVDGVVDYVVCSPWVRGTLRKLGPFAP